MKIILFSFITPFPTFPHGGRRPKQSLSPLGEIRKGVYSKPSKYMNYCIVQFN
jgi:hypothetical protein